MDSAKFFDHIRASLFGGKLTQDQVEGTQSILSASKGLPVEFVAYILATAYHETGMKMVPNRESMNYSVQGLLNTFGRHRISAADAQKLGRTSTRPADQRAIANKVYGGEWGRVNLGNIQPKDGWDFRGGGQIHTTGRTNYERVKNATGVDVVANPDLILTPDVSAKALVIGAVQGWYTGKKLADYLPGNYREARRVVNALDKADQIAGYAVKFETALRTAGWGSEPEAKPVRPDVDNSVSSIWSAIIAFLKSIFGGSK